MESPLDKGCFGGNLSLAPARTFAAAAACSRAFWAARAFSLKSVAVGACGAFAYDAAVFLAFSCMGFRFGMRCGVKRSSTNLSLASSVCISDSSERSWCSISSMRCTIRSRCPAGRRVTLSFARSRAGSLTACGSASNCAISIPRRALCIVLPPRTASCSTLSVRVWVSALSSLDLAMSRPLSRWARSWAACRISASLDATYLISNSSVKGTSMLTGVSGSRTAIRNCCSCG
mmetsp:Transcript_3579/g.8577  ORF Transcript_3579/g.8577 Transcript_3579/m.8577 type:complete len:232 (-) Transcript_3579:529-1224(-)